MRTQGENKEKADALKADRLAKREKDAEAAKVKAALVAEAAEEEAKAEADAGAAMSTEEEAEVTELAKVLSQVTNIQYDTILSL